MKTNGSILKNKNYKLPQIYVKSGCSKLFRRKKKFPSQKLTPEAVVRRCSIKGSSLKFRKIHGKISVLQSVEPCNFIEKTLQQSCFPLTFRETFKNSYFIEHLGMTASGILNTLLSNFSVT